VAGVSSEEVLRSYFEAIGRRDLDAMAEHWSPEVVEDITGVGILRGPDELRAFFSELFAAMPDLETTVQRMVASGSEDVVVVEWRMRGNFTGGQFRGIDPTGAHLELRGCDVFELEDGKIARYTAYQDGMETARAIGMMPPADSPGERAMIAAFNAATKVRAAVRERMAR
jgi:steroid delta-isomerase-like uncharacterized protein